MAVRPINVLSVASGIGLLDLGIRLACGATRTVCYVEREAFSASNLVQAMGAGRVDPAPIWSDLRTFDAQEWRGVVDFIAGGIPCQPYSAAGKQRHGRDDRDLVDELVRVVAECEPAVVFLEEVPTFVVPDGLGRLGYGLRELGYRVEAPIIVAASDVGAPHQRRRLFVLAWRVSDAGRGVLRQLSERCESVWRRDLDGPPDASPIGGDSEPRNVGEEVEHADSLGREEVVRGGEETARWPVAHDDEQGMADSDRHRRQGRREERVGFSIDALRDIAHGRHPRSLWPPGPDDTTGWRDYIAAGGPQPGIRGGAHGVPHRVDRVRALGNGVVPLAVAYAFRTLVARAQRGREPVLNNRPNGDVPGQEGA